MPGLPANADASAVAEWATASIVFLGWHQVWSHRRWARGLFGEAGI
jgi:hypothetical protein